ncbi:DUF6471 domain-containing protein [Gemmobacter aquatilis]|uniref:DUF6471 domain-containing protein n=1 Tax=Gemmobacter aquatilis TaxID=933059 RepID=UPI001FE1E7E6|nr:DUF6471 domain-containing protein [Gemmobacter aquatilis]
MHVAELRASGLPALPEGRIGSECERWQGGGRVTTGWAVSLPCDYNQPSCVSQTGAYVPFTLILSAQATSAGICRPGTDGRPLLTPAFRRKGVTSAQRVEKLAVLGIDGKEGNARNTLSCGEFTAAFQVQCLNEIGCEKVGL